MGNRKLTRTELVKHIHEIMPSDLTEYEKLAFIEREVAKHISFDEKYLWGNTETREKIYRLSQKEAEKPSDTIQRKIICINISELFGYVAKNFGFEVIYQARSREDGIKAGNDEIFKNISEKRKEHVCVIVGLSNGQFIEVDVQDDLTRLQTRSKPQAFGGKVHGTQMNNGVKVDVLDEKLVEKTFRRIYDLKEEESFTDEYIKNLAEKLRREGKKPTEMLQIFMNDSRVKEELQNSRCMEANEFYKGILAVCFGGRGEKAFSNGEDEAIIEECILSDGENRKRYSFCIYAENAEQRVFYVYSKKSKRMITLTLEEIQQMKQKDVDIELRGFASYLRRRMISFINNDMTSLQEKTPVTSLEDIFEEKE